MNQYSFLKHPIHNFINNLSLHAKGIKNAYGLFCDFNKKIRSIDINLKDESSSFNPKIIHSIEKFRNESTHLSWISSDMLPFKGKKKKSLSQLEIQNEIENSYLILKFLSPIDHFHDVLILQISGIHCFGLSKSSSPVSSSDKALIGNLLNLMAESSIQNDYNDISTLNLINSSYDSQLERINLLEKKNKTITDNASKTIQIFVDSLIKKWEIKTRHTIELQSDVVEDIISSNQNIDAIETTFEQAILIALNTKSSSKKTISLQKAHFLWKKTLKSESRINSLGRYSNILEFLDRYEKAAQIALENGWKINGSTVGKSCYPAVSPASITFNLKKYSKNVRELFQQYTNRWPTLELYFRPFQNVILSEAENQASMSA